MRAYGELAFLTKPYRSIKDIPLGSPDLEDWFRAIFSSVDAMCERGLPSFFEDVFNTHSDISLILK
jgi:hypothetical protein